MSADLFMRRGAEFDQLRSARFSLDRIWDARLPLAAWLMCNPSIADDEDEDPTLRRVITFSRSAGCGGAAVVNVWPIIATEPAALWRNLEAGQLTEAMAKRNADAVLAAGTRSRVKFLAFGVEPMKRDPLMTGYAVRLFTGGEPAFCLGRSPEGWPLHPLARGKFAIRKGTVPTVWSWPGAPEGTCRGCVHWSGWLPNVGDCMLYAKTRRERSIRDDDCTLPEMHAPAVHGDFTCPAWEARTDG